MSVIYCFTKGRVEKFAKWTGIKLTFKGSDSGTVTKQSVESETDIDGVKKITITLGE